MGVKTLRTSLNHSFNLHLIKLRKKQKGKIIRYVVMVKGGNAVLCQFIDL